MKGDERLYCLFVQENTTEFVSVNHECRYHSYSILQAALRGTKNIHFFNLYIRGISNDLKEIFSGKKTSWAKV